MARPKNERESKRNPTHEKLRGTPFDSVDDYNKEIHDIRRQIWRRFTEAQVIDELLTKSEFAFIRDDWKEGIRCYLEEAGSEICHVFADSGGLKVQINKAFVDTLGERDLLFLEGVVRSNIEGYGALYYRMRGLLKSDTESGLNFPSSSEQKLKG
jgi:hypothetical protein